MMPFMARKKITKLSITLSRVLEGQGLGGRLHEYRIFALWEKIAGPAIARHAQPISLRGGKLSLVVDSATWMHQLTMLKPVIIEKVNSLVGKGSIKDIALKTGEVAPPRQLEEPPPLYAPLDALDCAKIESVVHDIKDEEIRESLRRLIEKDLMHRKAGK